MQTIRMAADGAVLREVRVKIRQASFRRLKARKAQMPRSSNLLLREILRPALERLPEQPPAN